ncbi:MAG: M28 family metallopeptidase [Flavicella sp.]
MIYKLMLAALLSFSLSCTSTQKQFSNENEKAIHYAKTITLEELKENVYEISSDAYEGRNTGEPGQKKAAKFLKDFYKRNGIESAYRSDDYFQEIPASFLPDGIKASENVVAYIEGTEFPNEILVISAHYDHIGMDGEEVFNGADDDGSGTIAVLEMAQAFQLAKNAGHGPKRSILFLNNTAEEKGLYGSKWYVEHPIFPMENHIANLNIDMIGRIDPQHKNNPNYLYLIGSDRLSKELHAISETANNTFTKIDIDYTFNDPKDPNMFYYRSDHYNFAKNNVPVIFYFNGVHEDYHKITDTPDKIDYELLRKRAQLIFYTAWELVNRPQRVRLD